MKIFRPFKFIFIVIGFLCLLVVSCQKKNVSDNVNLEALFVHEIIPVFESKCMGCHGNEKEKIEGGLNLSNYQNLLNGGDSGNPSIQPGKPGKSFIIHAINRESEQYAMPPKLGDKLSSADIEIIEKWIAGGAPWPDDETRAKISADTSWSYGNRLKVITSGGQSKVWDNRKYQKENLWAYYPLSNPEIPSTQSNTYANPIDAFLQRKRINHGLTATTATSKQLLFRRATIDLTGLPPNSKELTDFVSDESSDAFEKVIDRLLASPHYGEQWGRHWLDIVRYADSGGFSNDFIRPNAWRYRDYVVRSFNRDKPYNQFVMEQLAGDEIDSSNPEMLIATGFLRMGPWEHTGMSVAAETRQFYLDDVTNIVGETFLSTPLNCAKCHDHKYDPIPTKDYYSIQAVFATTQFADRKAEFLSSENIEITASEKERIIKWIEKTEYERKQLSKKEEKAARDWYDKRGLAYLPKSQRRKLPEDQQPPRYHGLNFKDLGYRKVLQKRIQLLRRQNERFKPLSFSVYEGPLRIVRSQDSQPLPDNFEGPIPKTFILEGGSVYAPLDLVEPGILSVIESFQSGRIGGMNNITTLNNPDGFKNRRLTFANWVTDQANPIFTRSIVNRIWQYHFGKGIAETPNNFGATGGKPTHPELLDWLSNYFIENNYSIKKLHKLIMTSEAYKMSSEHPDMENLNQLDPENDLLCYFSPRRLEAEEIKDAMLALSGELNLTIGGFPVRPEINLEVALQPRHTMGSIAPAYQPSRTPEERNRRSIYAEKYRTLTDPDLEVFNKPGADLSCEKRNESTVTPQVFTMLNGNNTRARSIALAHKLLKHKSSDENLIRNSIKLMWCREPTTEEITESKIYFQKMITYHKENQPPINSYPTTVTRKMFEEMTGEPFEYEEELDIYHNYIPDLQPADVDAKTRALADLIAVLFNSNEFVYVY